jgi:hypothetical protein
MSAMAGAYYLMADAIQQTTLADAVGPQGLPKAYAAILAALAVVLIARGKGEGGRGEGEEPSRHWRAAGLILIGVAYIAVVPWLGYALSVAALLAATARYQGGELTGRVMLVAVAGAACFWLLFVVLLRIPQPAGVWPSLF